MRLPIALLATLTLLGVAAPATAVPATPLATAVPATAPATARATAPATQPATATAAPPATAPAGSPAASGHCLTLPGFNERCAEWSFELQEGDPAADDCSDDPARMVMGGDAVYMTGTTTCSGPDTWDILTIAVGTDGALRWSARHEGSVFLRHQGFDLAISPDGETLYVAGAEDNGDDTDWIVLAYAAATGDLRWAWRHDGPAGDDDEAWGVAPSDDGARVYVTGIVRAPKPGGGSSLDLGVASLDAATGEADWIERYAHPEGWGDYPRAIGTSGGSIVVTGSSLGTGRQDLVTLAYRDDREEHRAEPLWADTFDGGDWDQPAVPCLRRRLTICGLMGTIAVTPATAAITGTSFLIPTTDDAIWTTIAYDLATGERRWLRHRGDPEHQAKANAIAASPGGETIYVTGFENDEELFDGIGDAVTVAYDAATGEERWAARQALPAIEDAAGFGLAPTAGAVYVTGAVNYWVGDAIRVDSLVLAYDAPTGARRWIARHNRYEGRRAGIGGSDGGSWPAVTPDGSRLLVGGEGSNTFRIENQFDYRDFSILAYRLD